MGNDESKIIEDRVICELCGEKCHAISVHLGRDHGPMSEDPCTIEQYKERFPAARLMSAQAQKMLDERKSKKATRKTSVFSNIPVGAETVPLAETFGLGSAPGAHTKDGKSIPVRVCTVEGFDELIPQVDEEYIFPIDVLKSCLMAMDSGEPIYLYGHAGVGKTSLFEQICARTKRPMVRVQHNTDTELAHIVGQKTVDKHINEDGQAISVMSYEWGALPLAMKNGWVYCADEYDRCPPEVASVYQAILEGKPLYVMDAPENERLIKPHPDFRFVATGNTNGSGDETGLYQATTQQDAANMERFAVEKVDYMSKKQEIAMIQKRTDLLLEDAELIWRFCDKVREAFPNSLSLTIGPRVAIKIAKFGILRGDMKKGVALAYSNRLPETEKQAADEIAQRIFG